MRSSLAVGHVRLSLLQPFAHFRHKRAKTESDDTSMHRGRFVLAISKKAMWSVICIARFLSFVLGIIFVPLVELLLLLLLPLLLLHSLN